MGIFRRAGSPFERGDLFRALCARAFNQCDVDGSGTIDVKELHIGLLILYDKINSILPIHYPIPSKQEVVSLLKRFDVDRTYELDFEEFYELSKSQMGFNRQEWYQSIWFRVISKWTLKAAIYPAAGVGLKKGLLTLGAPIGVVPTAIVAYAVEAGVKSLSSLR